MKITDDELLDLIEDITVSLGQILLTHRELTEGLLDDGPTIRSQQKIEDLKKRLEDEKVRLAKSRRFQQRKKELEKLRRDHDKEVQSESKTTPIQNGSGKVIGWVLPVAKDRIHFLDHRGQVIGRFIHGQTYDHRGRFVGSGNQGLRVLGQILRKVGP
jgi:ATPase subunit of ABC transporter with duplicated ATPase domains